MISKQNDILLGSRKRRGRLTCLLATGLVCTSAFAANSQSDSTTTGPAKAVLEPRTSLGKDDGYRGIWYATGATGDEYKYKYAGGLGTYCAKHSPLAIHAPKVNKTFFCYGGTVKGKNELLEMVLWISKDQGQSWTKVRDITRGSPLNHTYARRPVNAHPDFYTFWADGNARRPSESRLYFCNQAGDRVFRLPAQVTSDTARPEPVTSPGR